LDRPKKNDDCDAKQARPVARGDPAQPKLCGVSATRIVNGDSIDCAGMPFIDIRQLFTGEIATHVCFSAVHDFIAPPPLARSLCSLLVSGNGGDHSRLFDAAP